MFENETKLINTKVLLVIHRVSVPAEGMRRIDPTSSQKSRFSHQIHTFFYLKPQNWDVSCFSQTAGATF